MPQKSHSIVLFGTGDLLKAVEVRHDILARAVVHDLPVPHEKDVVEQLVRLSNPSDRLLQRAPRRVVQALQAARYTLFDR